jgi:hypothetical protein
VIPIPLSHLPNALPSFHSVANKYQLQFHELPPGVPLEDLLSPPSDSNPHGIPGGPFEEYFYAEIPLQDTVTKKRFVFMKERKSTPIFFPMHLGMELAATTLEKPERANWKNCLLSEDEEEVLADKFRKLFEKYDFT